MNDDRAREAADHLQSAVRELIAAGQALLAAFDDVVGRPDTAPNLLAAIESVAKRFLPNQDDAPDDEDDDNEDDVGNDGFEPIKIE
jgi:hypothetical protein